MAVLAALALISTTVFVMATTEIRMAVNYQWGTAALYSADGGANYVKKLIEDSLAAGTLQLTNPVETVNFTSDSSGGMQFDRVTNLVRLADGRNYTYTVTGRSSNTVGIVEVALYRLSLLEYGVFGDQQVDAKANGSMYSFWSDKTPNPTAADSTGDADMSSNEDIITHSGTYIDGDLALGADAFGNQATWSDPGGGTTVTGEEAVPVDRVDPDPLGAVGGGLATQFTAALSTNNNAKASPAIPTNRKILLGNGEVMVLTSGVYSVSSIDLGNGASLIINNTNGPVYIYLTGGANFKNGSSVNIFGVPTDFFLYSNSSADIDIFHGGSFKGFLYAPYSNVEIKNSGDFYGIVWASYVDIKNSGSVFIDLSLTKKTYSNKTRVTSWKESRPNT